MVDDRPENLIALEAVLDSLDVQTFKAASAAEALRLLLQHEFAVILLDVEMPGMDGFEAARLIRSRNTSWGTPIIFLTAIHRSEDYVRRGYAAGAVDYLVKPFIPEILRWKVSVLAELYTKSKQAEQWVRNQMMRVQHETVAQRAQLLAKINVMLASSSDYNSSLRGLADVVVPVLADGACVYVDRDGSLRPEKVTFVPDVSPDAVERLRSLEIPLTQDDNPVVRAALDRAVLRTKAAARPHLANGIQQELMSALGVSGVLAIPLLGRDRAVGVLALFRASPAVYGQMDEDYAEELSTCIGLAISNAQLYEMAQAANRAKDQFLAIASHELRTPLTAILGWVRLLQTRTMSPETQVVALETIERNARAQEELITDILDLSRIAAGQLSVKFKPVALESLAATTIESLRPLAEAKDITLDMTADCQVAEIIGDTRRLQQILWNLLANAIKFTPRSGRIHTIVRTDQSHAFIEVHDTGKGILAEILPRIFEPFIQGDESATREHGGLGLGLAITHHLVELHGGTITAESPGEGCGATFRVTLPVRSAAQAAG